MRVDQVDTLVEQLEDFIKAVIRNYNSDSEAEYLVLNNMRESLKEYMIELLGIKPPKDLGDLKCPDCGSDMIERKNKTSGNIFYGCKKFPNCKGTRDEDGLSRDERAEKKDKEVQHQDGFSFNRNEKRW